MGRLAASSRSSSFSPPRFTLASLAFVALGMAACNTGPKEPDVRPDPKSENESAPAASSPAPTTAAPTTPTPTAAAPAAEGALRLGAPIEASVVKVALTDVAKNPSAFVGKKFATTGTVSAVCQHMGCWMEIKDESGEAHIKMAGHAFFVPKTASGHKARVLATLVKGADDGACGEGSHDTMAAAGGAAGARAKGGPKKGCRAEAEAQLGRPLAKLELIAEGVELL
jgi:Rieske Fe-S protein